MASEFTRLLPKVSELGWIRSGLRSLIRRNRYACDLTPDQKDVLLDVVRAHPHPQISPEVRRELVNSVARGETRMEDRDGDVAMGL